MKKVKKVNMVDVFSVQYENGTFKPVEITVRRGLK
jgi:predicted DNA-binding antitoxin AbrB/MazE fold protein